MTDWLAENTWPVSLLFGVAALVCFYLWWDRGRARQLIAGILLLAVSGGLIFLERSLTSESERIGRMTEDLCRAFQQRDRNRTLNNFSQQAEALKVQCLSAMEMVKVDDDLRVSDVSVRMVANRSRAIVHFRANATISVAVVGSVGYQPSRWEITWQREAGEWKIIDVTRLDPLTGKSMDVMSQRTGGK